MDNTPFAQAPGTGASVSTWSLGMSVAELTLAGPAPTSPSPRQHSQRQSPWPGGDPRDPFPHVTAPGTPGHREGDRQGQQDGGTSPQHLRLVHHPLPRGSVPLSPEPGAGGGQGRIRACLGHVPSFSA